MGSYFIRIDEATDVRRKVLETSKASLHIMRSYHKILKVRSEKQTMMKALRRELKELTMLINRLEELSPTLTQAEVKAMHLKKSEPKRESLEPSLTREKTKQKPKKRGSGPHVYVGVNKPKPLAKRAPAPKRAEKAPAQEQRTPAQNVADKLSEIERKLSGL